MGTKIRTYSGAILSAETLNVGGKYYIYVGGDVSGEEVTGVYDVATVTDFNGGVQQCVSGELNVGGRPNWNPNRDDGFGQTPPDRFKGETPDGFGQGNMTPPDWQNNSRPEMPNDFNGQMPEDFNGQMPNGQMPEGFGDMFGGFTGNGQGQSVATCTLPREFELTKRVNAFSVSDVRHSYEADSTECSACKTKQGENTSSESTSSQITAQPLVELNQTAILNLVLSGVCVIIAVVVLILAFKKKK